MLYEVVWMAVKYVAVIVDDFTWRSYSRANVTTYDYAIWATVSCNLSYYYDWFKVQRYADAPTLADCVTTGPYFNGYNDGREAYHSDSIRLVSSLATRQDIQFFPQIDFALVRFWDRFQNWRAAKSSVRKNPCQCWTYARTFISCRGIHLDKSRG